MPAFGWCDRESLERRISVNRGMNTSALQLCPDAGVDVGDKVVGGVRCEVRVADVHLKLEVCMCCGLSGHSFCMWVTRVTITLPRMVGCESAKPMNESCAGSY